MESVACRSLLDRESTQRNIAGQYRARFRDVKRRFNGICVGARRVGTRVRNGSIDRDRRSRLGAWSQPIVCDLPFRSCTVNPRLGEMYFQLEKRLDSEFPNLDGRCRTDALRYVLKT